MKQLLKLLLVLLLLQYSAAAANWSCYFDTARVTVPTPSGQYVTMTLYNTSGVAVSTASGYFYWQGAQMVGWFQSSSGSAGTYTAGIIGTDGLEYRTNPFNLVDVGNGGLNGPGWIHGEAFPNGPVTILNGNHAITGTLDIDGNKLTLGTQVVTPTLPGFSWDYVPVAGSSTLGSLVSSTSHSSGSWSWAANGTTLMSLSPTGMTLNVPLNATSFNVGSNVAITQPNTVPTMTLQLAGATTVTSKGIAIGEAAKVQNGIGTGSVAIGRLAETNGDRGTAVGPTARAIGNNATAFGANSYANGASSVAVGYLSTSDSLSTAIGYLAVADGPDGFANQNLAVGAMASSVGRYSTSVGTNAYSGGWQSVSLGYYTAAYGANQTVIGRLNSPSPTTPQTNTLTFQDSSITFVVGNGYTLAESPYTTVNQNVITVRRDNGTAIGKEVSSGAGGQVVVGRYNAVNADGAFVVGIGANGAPLNGMRVTNDGAVLIRPKGDIGMGTFQAGQQP